MTNDSQRFLRWALRGNALFSGVCGLIFCLGSSAVAAALGLATSPVLVALGSNLLGFAALLAWLATRDSVPRRVVVAVVAADLLWVAATVPLVASDLLGPVGDGVAVLIAGVVLTFAVLQAIGLRRARRTLAAGC